ncbi:esterase FE4-like [Ostrinia nubilalis]|uniref:esterase FE4-like n=1 Tax=Ostrinia nubilalis TaxID=29057 RepID=UPI00308222A6
MLVIDTMRLVSVVCFAACCVVFSQCEQRAERVVRISQGPVRGYKDPEHDLFEFYGIPYATAPTGPNKFKAPLPAPAWLSTFEAVNKDLICPQVLFPDAMGQDIMIIQENCLIANVFVPDTAETNLPVVVYVHGGAYQMGYGNFFMTKKLVQQSKKIISVTFNYRLGIPGFLCLGTNDIPGNAGMKDQVALLRWVKKNIASFGGNPDDVTIAGYSAGSSSVDLLMLSPLTKGLFNKVIPESGANLAAFSVQTDPVKKAREYASRFNVTNLDDIYELELFYKNAPLDDLFTDSFILSGKDNTFGFSPCVEKKTSEESFLDESPFAILNSGNYEKVPVLYGFSNMEGLIRIVLFDTWKENMNEKFSDFLPADLQFTSDEERESVARKVKEFYFGDKAVSSETVLGYIDYFTDVLFAYATLRAVKLHVKAGNDKIYLYEYSFTDDEDPNFVVPYTNNVRGANHCAQSTAVLDVNLVFSRSEDNITEEYKNNRATMRELWTNFIITGSPVPAGSALPAWPAAGAGGAPHMSLARTLRLRGALLEERARFWDAIYERHYRAPAPPPPPPARHSEL